MTDQVNNPFNLPTERIDLPSKGLLYPTGHPLKEGFVEICYPTAKHEDILTNINYLRSNIAEEKFLEALLVTKFNMKDLLQGDKDAIMLAARILAYGKDYAFFSDKKRYTVDLTTLKEKSLDEALFKSGVNEFSFTLPIGKAVVTYKYLTLKDEDEIQKEEDGIKKIQPDYSAGTTLFLRQSILSVNGDKERSTIHKFVDRILLQDAKALRKHIIETKPGIDMTTTAYGDKGEVVEGFRVPITIDFFWPEY